MSLKKGCKVYKMKYIRDGFRDESQWSVNVIAMSWNDAENWVQSRVEGKIRIEERGGTWDIDSITPESEIADKPEVIEKVVVKREAVEVSEEDDGRIKCPWCNKDYAKMKTFETHAKKAHGVVIG